VAWVVQIVHQEKDFLQESGVTQVQISQTGADTPILEGFKELTRQSHSLLDLKLVMVLLRVGGWTRDVQKSGLLHQPI